MKYLGSMTDSKDLVNKGYVDKCVHNEGAMYDFTFTPTATGNYNSRIYYDVPVDDWSDYDIADLMNFSFEFYITQDGMKFGSKSYFFNVYPYVSGDSKYYRFYALCSSTSTTINGTTYYTSIQTGATVIVHSPINVQGTLTVATGM